MSDTNTLQASNNEKKLFFYGVLVGIMLGLLLITIIIGFLNQ